MSIPTAKMRTDSAAGGDDFAERLDEVIRKDSRDEQPVREEVAQQDAETPTPSADQPREAQSREGVAETDTDAAPAENPAAAAAATQRADSNDIREGEAPVSRRFGAGKGAGASPSQLPSSGNAPRAAVDTVIGFASGAANRSAAVPVPGVAATATAHTPATAPTASANGVSATTAASATAKASAATPSYRTLSAATLQMAEQARDSVFRQIAMRLMPDGGEMTMLLDPPQLGELEMRIVVEGDSMRLSVTAERPEVALMMQKHLAELRAQLEAQGLTITDAEIRERGDRTEQSGDRDTNAHRGEGNESHDEGDAKPALEQAPRGFITADGLDFWV